MSAVEFQRAVRDIRTAARDLRIIACTAPRVIGVRGTAAEVSVVSNLVRQP